MFDRRRFMEVLRSHCHVRKYLRGDIVLDKDRGRDQLFVVVDGWLEFHVERRGLPRRRLVLWRLYPGDLFGYESFLGNTLHASFRVMARRDDTRVAGIDLEKLNGLLQQGPLSADAFEFVRMIGHECMVRVFLMCERLYLASYRGVRERVLAALLHLAGYPDAQLFAGGVQVSISLIDLGLIVGCSREAVGIVVNDLEGEGLLRRSKDYCIYLDVEAVNENAEV